MGVRGLFRACLFVGLLAALVPRPAAAQSDDLSRLVLAIEAAIRAGDAPALRALARPEMNRAHLSELAMSLAGAPAPQATVKERDRMPLANGGQRLLLEILTVTAGGEGRVWTWRVDALPGRDGGAWQIADAERLTQISGLYQLALDPSLEWDVHDAIVRAPDLTLTLTSGYVFAAQVPEGPTALVFVGRGSVLFAPTPDAERGQLRIFCGADALRTSVNALFIRLAPGEFAARVSQGALKPRAVDPAHLRRAAQVFDAQLSNSFQVDLNDLSSAKWSLVPSGGDFVAEIATGKYGALTYARSSGEPEDISFFDRRRRRNISVYASPEQLARHGRFFSEDDQVDYDVTHYDVDAAYWPERLWIDATAKLSIQARDVLAGTLMLHLADPLVVRSITSPQLGRLLHLRVVGQSNVLVGLPAILGPGTDFDLVITYGGRLQPQSIEREVVSVAQDPQEHIPDVIVPPEPQWVYSNGSYWYPQSTVTDYATATLAVTVPDGFDVVASGTPQGPPSLLPASADQEARKRFVFAATQPARYLAFVASRFRAAPPVPLKLRDDAEPLQLLVTANPRQTRRMRPLGEKAADILKFYGGLLGDAPYDSFTLAITEGDLPGGHSPAYFALVRQPLPTSPYVWSSDPVSFPGYPSFFLAHEVAHQWWGQGVAWKNYHEQWLSEGFAQYFAAMYAEKERGADAFGNVIRQMRRWAMDMSPQGPVYLGYRLGHIRADSRVFRALVYNKGAMALHMLRRLIGDEAFFAGLRDFYQTWRYKKAGTDDLRVVMEKASGVPLERFFDRWIYGAGLPSITFTYAVEGTTLKVRFAQKGDVYDIPITVTIAYADGTSEDVLVKVTSQTTEQALPLKGAVRSVEANKDGAALVDIAR